MVIKQRATLVAIAVVTVIILALVVAFSSLGIAP